MSADDLLLKEQLQRAVRSQEVPPYLEARIRANLKTAPSSRWHARWAVAGLAAAGLLGVTIAYQLGHLRVTHASQEAYITSVSNHVASILRVGLGDHLHCAYFRKFPKTAPKIEELTADLEPDYRGLIPIVQKQMPARYRVELAHKCRYHGREFIHVALRNDKQLMSLVIATKRPGESLGSSFLSAGVQRFEMASFETRDHLVYFISDLPAQENRAHLLAMAPAVQELLGKLEL
jgi:hypothetical protein